MVAVRRSCEPFREKATSLEIDIAPVHAHEAWRKTAEGRQIVSLRY